MTNDALLRMKDVTASYGAVTALRNVDLEIPPASIVTLLGANGAGKSTLLRAISNVVRRQGLIEFRNRSTQGMPTDAVARLGIAHVPEGREIFPSLSVRNNLLMGTFAARDHSATQEDLELVYKYFPILKERADQVASSLSGGEQQMLAIGRALVSQPELILLDEPSLGLSPRLVKGIFQIIRRINAERGTAVLLVEQNASLALRTASFGYVLEIGRIVAADDCQSLLKSSKIRQAYLGLGG